MIQWILAIWSLIPLPFLKPVWTSESSWFTYYWSLAWRILSITLLEWTKVHDIVQETGIKTIPMEKKCKKAKWLSMEAWQIAVKRREAKSQGGKERYKHLNAELQRIARRDKKAFFTDQCKEIEEKNRMGKTRDLFKKIRDIKGIFHAKLNKKRQKWSGPNRSRRY